MTGKLRAGVVGAGVFGGYHASKYAGDDRVDLAAIFDIDLARAQGAADQHGGAAFADLGDFAQAVDLASVASPAPSHADAARRLLAAGVHVLVEKPLATDAAAAGELVEMAHAAGRILQVGHQERFVLSALGVFDIQETPLLIEARRCNPFHERGSDVSVTLDLMTHDLDLVRVLAGRVPVASISATQRRERTVHPDAVDAHLTFANGVEARLSASRLNAAPDRGLRLVYASGEIAVDFVAKSVTNTTPHAINPDFANDPSARDSLGASVAAFVSAVHAGAPVIVTGEDGREAVALAEAIDAAAGL